MQRWKFLIVTTTLVMGLLACHSSFAQSVAGCGVGNQDSTCLGRVNAAPQAAPTCSTAAGWTTVASAQWIGSGYSAPQCNYQAPPSCPAGDITTSSALWDGSEWVGLGCQAPAPQPPAYSTQCTAGLPAGFILGQQAGFYPDWDNPTYDVGANAYGFPYGDTVYATALYGPQFESPCGVAEEDYIGYCAISPSGWLDGEAQWQEMPTTGQCNH